MSTIRLRLSPGRIVSVDVKESRCPSYGCFWPSLHTIRSSAGSSGCSSRTTDSWECGRREQRGCPEHPVVDNHYRKRSGVWDEVPPTHAEGRQP